MKNWKRKTFFSLIFLFVLILCFCSFNISVSAKSFKCTYGEDGAFKFEVYLDKTGSVNYKTLSAPGSTVIKSASLPISNFIVSDGSENYYCPKELRLKRLPGNYGDRFASYNLAVFSDYTDSESNKAEYGKIVNLTDSNVDNSSNLNTDDDPDNNQNKTLVRSCNYGSVNLNYYSDGTVTGTSNGTNLTIREDVKNEIKNSCPEDVYLVAGKAVAITPHWSDSNYSVKYDLNKKDSHKVETSEVENDDDSNGDKCDSLFGDPDDPEKKDPAYWMQWVLNVMKYVAIGALLLFVSMDFAKALIGNDKDALKKAGTTAMKRFIYCVLIFFLPIIVDLIMSMFGAYGTCGLG